MTTCNSDGFAPDPELIKALTPEDFVRHVHSFGQANSGMSSYPLLQQYVERWIERRGRIQAKWDARKDRMRLQSNTAPALAPSRRTGRL